MFISDSEKRLWLAVTASVLVITSFPYLFGHLFAPPDRQFMSILLNPTDYGQYLSWFREFKSANLIENKLTSEPNEPIFFNLLWWVMGRTSRYTGLGFPILHQLLRLFSGIAFLYVLRLLCARVLPELRVRNLAFFLAVFGAGFGWILVVMKYTVTKGELLYPLDVYIAEPNSFLSIMAVPHFILANAFIIAVFLLALKAYSDQQLRYALAAGVVSLVLALQHAYDLLIIYGVLVGFMLLVAMRERRIPWFLVKSNLIIGVISWWPGLYSVWLTRSSDTWKQVLVQFSNAGVYTPDPFHLIILMGIPLVLAVLTFDGLFSSHDNGHELLFIKAWFIIGFILLYVPTDFQVHMLNSWQVPVAILAAKGFHDYVIPVFFCFNKEKYRLENNAPNLRLVTVVLILLVSLTNVYLYAWRFVELARHDYPYYLYRDEFAAFKWLEKNTKPDEVVLSSYSVGNYIPAFTGNKAFLAHWATTVDFYKKRELVSRFFDVSVSDQERVETLDKYVIDYVFFGPSEKALGTYDPGTSPWLKLMFTTPRVNIYLRSIDVSRNDNGSRAIAHDLSSHRLRRNNRLDKFTSELSPNTIVAQDKQVTHSPSLHLYSHYEPKHLL